MSQKYLFDTSFEAEDLGGGTVAPSRKPPPPKFDEEDLEQARREGHETGKKIGTQEALQNIEQKISQAVKAISAQMGGLAQAQAESHERQNREALEVALTVVRKIIPGLTERHGMAEVETVVRDCLERLRDEPRIVIRVADDLLDRVETRVGELAASAGFEGRIVYLAQDGLKPGDVRVEWADGGAERDSERLWREIDEIIARIASPGRPEVPAKPSESPEPAAAGSTPTPDPNTAPNTAPASTS